MHIFQIHLCFLNPFTFFKLKLVTCFFFPLWYLQHHFRFFNKKFKLVYIVQIRLIIFKSIYIFLINLTDISDFQINLLITKLFEFFNLFSAFKIKKYFWNRKIFWIFYLKLVSVIFNQMIALQKLWKMFFISSKKLFSFLRYFNFCISVFRSFSLCQPLR